MKGFWPLDLIAGEAAFEAIGKTESKLFSNCVLALCSEMANTTKVKAIETMEIEKTGNQIDILLHNLLSEVVFLKDARRIVFKSGRVKVSGKNGEWKATAILKGQSGSQVDPAILRSDVKAVTFHGLRIWSEGELLKARVVLDI